MRHDRLRTKIRARNICFKVSLVHYRTFVIRLIFCNTNFIFSDTIYIGKGYKYPKIVVDGYEYNIQLRNKERTRWTCANYKFSRCKSIIYTYGKMVVVKNSHNHPSMLKKIDLEKLIPQKVTISRNFSS